ncbi:MAG TPA: FKBP-type peptidyl-prolyl cis-trans isomerase [Sphingomicrobium sp.]|nr:FKBP-type peptidyl-prolyl cis-trans isomerase [Sphingomicrobium sp.]
MTAAESANRPEKSGRTAALWIGFLLLIAAGIGLAWVGAGSLRPTVTQSGLEFRTLKGGSGEPIGHPDAALMDYILTADDGTVLDSSENHGGAQPFAMDEVFPGFAEAMTKMQEGGEYRFSMPQKLAFGDSPAPPGFPKNSKLNFEVRVRKVVRGGAALLRQQQQMQQQMPQQQQQGTQQ